MAVGGGGDGMMGSGGMAGMMAGMGFIWLLGIALLVLLVAALVKFLWKG